MESQINSVDEQNIGDDFYMLEDGTVCRVYLSTDDDDPELAVTERSFADYAFASQLHDVKGGMDDFAKTADAFEAEVKKNDPSATFARVYDENGVYDVGISEKNANIQWGDIRNNTEASKNCLETLKEDAEELQSRIQTFNAYDIDVYDKDGDITDRGVGVLGSNPADALPEEPKAYLGKFNSYDEAVNSQKTAKAKKMKEIR